jgi:hypothetical protein
VQILYDRPITKVKSMESGITICKADGRIEIVLIKEDMLYIIDHAPWVRVLREL